MNSFLDRFLPAPVVGALAGFAVGFLFCISLGIFGISIEKLPIGPLGTGLLGAICGCAIGLLYRQSEWGRSIALWCAGTAAVVGGLSFLAGFAGPIIFQPDSPQGPLLGIFITGPLGTVVGAVLGLLYGLVSQPRRS
jgi:hypothetical protein